MRRIALWAILFVFSLVALTACKSTYYSAYEKVGVYKRDLLKKRVAATRDEEKKTQEQFKDALTRLQELTNYKGGELEKRYRKLQSSYDDAARRVQAVHNRVNSVEKVANDLFVEWEKENQEISTPSLRALSRQQLADTRDRYDAMIAALKQSEASMDPVLKKLHDYVLALKHSLDAEAVAALQGEATNIQAEIARLIEDMNASIAKANEFISQATNQAPK